MQRLSELVSPGCKWCKVKSRHWDAAADFENDTKVTWLGLGWVGYTLPFVFVIAATAWCTLREVDCWCRNECNNTSIWTQVPRVEGADKILFSFQILFPTYIMTKTIKMAKWQNGKDAKMVLWISHWWSSEVLTKLFVLVTDLMNAEQVLADCEPKSGTTTNFRDKYCNILGSLNAIHIATILRSPKTSVKPDTLDTIYIYNGKSLSVSFWMQDTMGGVSIVNIVWQKYFYSPA